MEKRKAALHNLGCKVNAYETDMMKQALVGAGYEIVSFDEQADVYVVNTCSVTNMADRKSRQMLHRVRKLNPDAVIVGAGCYVQTDLEGALKDNACDILIGNNEKGKLVDLLEEYFLRSDAEGKITSVLNINEGKVPYEEMGLITATDRTRAFLKVQDGCNQFCSYCIIPFARGRIRSRDPKSVKEEVTLLARNGFKEIVLDGIHLSSYGYGENFGLLELISSLAEVEGIERIRIGSLEPRIITEEFTEKLSQIKKVCPHFHLSLQSGCDETLKRMNRKYTTKEYKTSCDILRKFYEHPAITTDIITGFPGETEEEFEKTYNFTDSVSFFETHVFPFSLRKGTAAERLEGHLTEKVKKERSARLLELDKKKSDEFRAYYKGKEVEVLFEEYIEKDGKRLAVGHTPEYVLVENETGVPGEIMKVTYKG